jgi:hypothetical protein
MLNRRDKTLRGILESFGIDLLGFDGNGFGTLFGRGAMTALGVTMISFSMESRRPTGGGGGGRG